MSAKLIAPTTSAVTDVKSITLQSLNVTITTEGFAGGAGTIDLWYRAQKEGPWQELWQKGARVQLSNTHRLETVYGHLFVGVSKTSTDESVGVYSSSSANK